MNNLIVLPILIPLLTGIVLIFFRRHIRLQKVVSVLAALCTLFISVYLLYTISSAGIQTLQLGGWVAPFGITLVADMFSALLVLTSSVVSIACLLFAFRSLDKERESYYFYAFFQLLLAGVIGSFLTGDLFNLFVCFEVMLIASYVLLSFGGTKIQLRESMKYVLINLLSSMLFIAGIAYLYAITGTLNMAHLSVLIAEAGQDGILTTVSLLFLLVFGIKAGLFLYFWLPGSYSAPPTAIAAMFGALLTKVGIYAIFRMFTLVFYHQPEITHMVMMWMAALTMILGAIGAVGHTDVRKILAYNVIIAVGFIVLGLAVFSSGAMMGSVYYLLHDMLVKALLFLIGGAMIKIAGTSKLGEMSGLIHHHTALGWMFFIAALALAGIPPLSGFLGKVLLIRGSLEMSFYWMAAIGLLVSLLILYSVMKIFIHGFWGESILSEKEEKGTSKGILIPCALLTALVLMYGLGAEWIYIYVEQAVAGLLDPNLYIDAVLD